jgi:hypothetical protein
MLLASGLKESDILDPLNEDNFVYIYAVYDNQIGKQQSYIISSALEDKNGAVTIWAIGSPTTYHNDFRTLNKKNITILGVDNNQRIKVRK